MENSVAEIIKIIKVSHKAIERERKLIIFFAQFISELMRMALEAIDDELQKEWRAKRALGHPYHSVPIRGSYVHPGTDEEARGNRHICVGPILRI